MKTRVNSNKTKKKPELSLEQATSICRGCLSTDRKAFSATIFEVVFRDLTGISITPSDGLPQVVCYECAALLQKYFTFRTKIIKSHHILSQYLVDRTLVAVDNIKEPLLVQSKVQFYEIPGTDADKLQYENVIDPEGDINDGDIKIENVVKEEAAELGNDEDVCSEPDPLSELFDYESDHSWSTNDLRYQEPATQEEELSVEFAIDAKTPSQQHGEDEQETQIGNILLSHGSNNQGNSASITANENEKRTKADTSIEDIKSEDDNVIVIDKPVNSNVLVINNNELNRRSDGKLIDVTNFGEDAEIKCQVNNKIRNVKSYICDNCNKRFRSKTNLKFHSHGCWEQAAGKPYKCDDCHKYFSNKYTLYEHSLTHIEKPYQCDICSNSYKNKKGLIVHMHQHVDTNEQNICYLCGKSYCTPYYLEAHIRQHLVKSKLKCDICKITFETNSELKRHAEYHSGKRPYKCDFCVKSYPHKLNLKWHIRRKHGITSNRPIERPFTCHICNKCFSNEKSYRTHFRNHTKPYQCDVCTLGYYKKESLIEHLTKHFGGEQCKCVVCGKMFNNKSALSIHMYTHPDYKPFKCHECGDKFSRVSELNMHVRNVHTKPYKCDVCMKIFNSNHMLQRHSIVHTGDKPHKCEICGRHFFSRHYLAIHIRIHTGEKPFKCEVCTKDFAAKTYLALHMRKHTGEKPHKCDICLKRFSQKNSLNTHYRTHQRDNFKRDKTGKRNKSQKR